MFCKRDTIPLGGFALPFHFAIHINFIDSVRLFERSGYDCFGNYPAPEAFAGSGKIARTNIQRVLNCAHDRGWLARMSTGSTLERWRCDVFLRGDVAPCPPDVDSCAPFVQNPNIQHMLNIGIRTDAGTIRSLWLGILVDQLESIRTFLEVVRSGSVAGAATKLAANSVVLGRHVKALETQLGVRLFSRSTRSMSLTEVGQAYFERVLKIVNDLDECEQSLASLAQQPAGNLRIVAPSFFSYRHLATYLHRYNCLYPRVRIALDLVDQPFDLINDGYDVALLASARIASTSAIARRLWDDQLVACASPAYLERCGTPTHPQDLASHTHIAMGARHVSTRTLSLVGPEGQFELEHKPAMFVDNLDALIQMIKVGMGIGLVPLKIAHEVFAQGDLTVVLPDYATPPVSISIVYPSREHLPAKVRTFIDFLVESAEHAGANVRPDALSSWAPSRRDEPTVRTTRKRLTDGQHTKVSEKFRTQSPARIA
ncbi:LysR family transcriptional regulator [Paraburkholderia bannensis]|uniref:LysR family transcriptional regulator n=1 Tax=Paraburkholderia bannensis TaxID=765414 RepID=UPI002AC31260|nr:LysR family transcriptional regulator [Paraburkholderia bannensis]